MYLIDSNVLIDIANPQSDWSNWSSATLRHVTDASVVCINPVIYAEVSILYANEQETDAPCPCCR